MGQISLCAEKGQFFPLCNGYTIFHVVYQVIFLSFNYKLWKEQIPEYRNESKWWGSGGDIQGGGSRKAEISQLGRPQEGAGGSQQIFIIHTQPIFQNSFIIHTKLIV